MPLTLLHGPAGAGKTTELLRLTAQKSIHDPFPDSFYYIVPSPTAVGGTQQKLIQMKGVPGLFIGEHVTTFDRFLLFLLKQNLPRVHTAEKSFVRNALRKLLFTRKYPSLEKIREFKSTPDELAATIIQLKKNGLDPAGAKTLFARAPTADLDDLIQLFADYQALLAELDHFDEGDLTLASLKLLRTGKMRLPDKLKALYIDRLFPITLGQREIIKELLKNFPELEITLSYSFDYEAKDDAHLYPAYNFLGESAHVSRYFRQAQTQPAPSLYGFPDPLAEIEWIAAEIEKACGEGILPDEIGVLCPPYPFYEERIEDRLSKKGIPWDLRSTPHLREFLPLKNIPEQTISLFLKEKNDFLALRLAAFAAVEEFETRFAFEEELLLAHMKEKESWKEEELKSTRIEGKPHTGGVRLLNLPEAIAFNFKKLFIAGFTDKFYPSIRSEHPFFKPEMMQGVEMQEILESPRYQWLVAKNRLTQVLGRSAHTVLTYPVLLWGNADQLPSRLIPDLPLAPTPLTAQAEAPTLSKRDYPKLRKKTFSMSELETYQQCPFQYYARHHLKLGEEPHDDTDVPLDAAGSFVHRVLEKLLKQHLDLYRDSIEYDLYLNRLLAVIPGLVADEAGRYTELMKTPKTLRDLFTARVTLAVGQLMKKEIAALRKGQKKTMPTHFEWAFGKGGIPPLRIKTDLGDILLSGRIDRIDTDPAKKIFTVMDYKTGKCDSMAQIREGESIQIPLYLMAVNSLLYPDYKPAGGLLVGLKDFKPSGFVVEGGGEEELMTKNYRLSAEALGQLKQALTVKIAGIVKNIQEGLFEPNPKQDSLCRTCDYRNICHYGK
ncbi:MAG: PD-(D/E)XK nuclease family protein [Deltaproteobacteria bacterium]|nr:PD-(D/E)XK nuclease family protein [Deltaproteobacteria bacterium]